MSILRQLRPMLFALTAMLPPLAAHADTTQPVLIIVDGSGSMWGKMEGDETAKFYGARDRLRERLAAAPAQSRIGLASFGHRRKGDCSDVEIVTPIEAGGAPATMAALDQLNPKGKGPLTAAIREGAKTIGPGASGHIILIHDNADNCGQDICSEAGDIAKSNPELRVHVVSLGLAKPEGERMQCLAATTKGLQFDASSQADVADALTQVFAAAGLDAAAALPAPAAAIAPAPPAAAKGPPGLRLSASLSEDGGPIDAAISWRIAKDDAPADAVPLAERSNREINEALEPGQYEVAVVFGLIERRFDIEAGADGTTVKRVNLDGGRMEVTATANQQGDPLTAPVMTVASLAADGVSPASTLWLGREASASLTVPAGKYLVEVSDGLARARQTVEIAPGALRRTALILDTGRLELSATAVAGGPPLERILYLVFADDPSAPEGRREVARSTAPDAAFTLQAGTYYITARHGAGERREQVALSSGDVVKRTLVLDVGKLTVKPVLAQAVGQPTRALATRVYEAAGEKRLVGQSTAAQPVFVLSAGQYRVEAQVGMSNIRANRVVDLTAGGDVVADVKLESAAVTIEGVTGLSTQASMRDASGRVVWRSRAGDATEAMVAPGTYVLQIEGTGAPVEKSVSVRPGEALTVDMRGP